MTGRAGYRSACSLSPPIWREPTFSSIGRTVARLRSPETLERPFVGGVVVLAATASATEEVTSSVLLELWTSREPSFTGKYTQFSGLVFEPKPLQKPYPPIWVGGHSRAALRRTVQFGAAWHPINRSPEELRAGRAELTRLSKVRGRTEPPTVTLRNDVRVLRPGQSVPASTHGGRVLAGERAALVDQIKSDP
ncbi:MAG: hypothetical protein DMD93_00055, partial [Candidatus Rokuibacteriota bacterium]